MNVDRRKKVGEAKNQGRLWEEMITDASSEVWVQVVGSKER